MKRKLTTTGHGVLLTALTLIIPSIAQAGPTVLTPEAAANLKVRMVAPGLACIKRKGRVQAVRLTRRNGKTVLVSLPSSDREKALSRCERAMRPGKAEQRRRTSTRCADVDLNGVVNDTDLSLFNDIWLARTPVGIADWDQNDRINSNDISAYLTSYGNPALCQAGTPTPTPTSTPASTATPVPTRTPTPVPTATPTPFPPSGQSANIECADGIDNDGDGLIDYADNSGLTEGAVGVSLGCFGPFQQETNTNYGFSIFSKASDARVIYVSSSSGNDANSGLSPNAPKRTIAAGFALMRNGYPDWLLLKRGDVFVNERVGTNGSNADRWMISGRGLNEPLLAGSYGPSSARPLIKSGANTVTNFQGSSVSSISHVALMGLEYYAHTRNPGDPAFIAGAGGSDSFPVGIEIIKAGTNFLFEDMKITYMGLGLHIRSQTPTAPLTNVRVRRSIISNSYSPNQHSQGIYSYQMSGLLLEGNVSEHNGWHPTVPGAGADIYSRNAYISETTNVISRDNFDVNGASGGQQLRMGGIVERNVYINNPVSLVLGHAQSPSGSTYSGAIRNNLVLGSRDVPGIPHGWGIGVGHGADGVEISGNIVSKNELGTGSIQGIFVNGNAWTSRNLDFNGNVVYRWDYNGNGDAFKLAGTDLSVQNILIRNNTFDQRDGGRVFHSDIPLAPAVALQGNRYYSATSSGAWFNIQGVLRSFAQFLGLTGESGALNTPANFPDPDRDMARYAGSLGSPATLEGFMTQLRLQSRGNYREPYTARAAINYVREGFGMAPIP